MLELFTMISLLAFAGATLPHEFLNFHMPSLELSEIFHGHLKDLRMEVSELQPVMFYASSNQHAVPHFQADLISPHIKTIPLIKINSNTNHVRHGLPGTRRPSKEFDFGKPEVTYGFVPHEGKNLRQRGFRKKPKVKSVARQNSPPILKVARVEGLQLGYSHNLPHYKEQKQNFNNVRQPIKTNDKFSDTNYRFSHSDNRNYAYDESQSQKKKVNHNLPRLVFFNKPEVDSSPVPNQNTWSSNFQFSSRPRQLNNLEHSHSKLQESRTNKFSTSDRPENYGVSWRNRGENVNEFNEHGFDYKNVDNKDAEIDSQKERQNGPGTLPSEDENYKNREKNLFLLLNNSPLLTTPRPSSAPYSPRVNTHRIRNPEQNVANPKPVKSTKIKTFRLETGFDVSPQSSKSKDLSSAEPTYQSSSEYPPDNLFYKNDPYSEVTEVYSQYNYVNKTSPLTHNPSPPPESYSSSTTVSRSNEKFRKMFPKRTLKKSLALKKKLKAQAEYQGLDGDSVPGTPGSDYPNFSDVPSSNFNCQKFGAPGFYADLETRCQVFHNCDTGMQKHSFLCPNGTVFRQELSICDWWFNVRCEDSPDNYPHINGAPL